MLSLTICAVKIFRSFLGNLEICGDFSFSPMFSYGTLCCRVLQVEGNDKYVYGPPFLMLLHPALGPLWEVTRQKVSS